MSVRCTCLATCVTEIEAARVNECMHAPILRDGGSCTPCLTRGRGKLAATAQRGDDDEEMAARTWPVWDEKDLESEKWVRILKKGGAFGCGGSCVERCGVYGCVCGCLSVMLLCALSLSLSQSEANKKEKDKPQV
jgi:hypothetical protein